MLQSIALYFVRENLSEATTDISLGGGIRYTTILLAKAGEDI